MKKLLAVLFAVSVFTAAYSDDKALIESQAGRCLISVAMN